MEPNRSPTITGKVTQVELCACGNGLTLMIGPVSLRLDPAAAEDVKATLAVALSVLARRAREASGADAGSAREQESN
jgi:hypothetical protein